MRFLIWVAVSSKEQAEKVSPELQEQLARQHVTRWGGTVADVLRVSESRDIVLLSDAAATIPAYAALHEAIQHRTIDVLICYDLGRLGRAYPLIMQIVELCSRAGIQVYEIENPPADLQRAAGYDEMLIRALKAVGYQHEVEKMRARMRFGREGRARAGKLTHVPPYGYAWRYGQDGARTVEIDADAAAVVQRIVAAYLAGRGVKNIALELTSAGIPTPSGGTAWQKNSVVVILGRAWTYAGYNEFRRDDPAKYFRVPGNWTPILDAATAERIASERQQRAVNRRLANTPSRLSGIVICAMCGRTMWQVRNEDGEIRDRMRVRRAKFYCQPYHRGGSIGTARVAAALEAAIDVLAKSDLSAIPNDDADRAAALQAQLDAHAAAIARHQAALRRADTAYVNGVMDEERYQEQVRRLRAAIETETTAQLQAQAAADAEQQRGSRRQRLEQIAAAGRAILTTPDTAAANTWLRAYVRVYVRDNQVSEVRFL